MPTVVRGGSAGRFLRVSVAKAKSLCPVLGPGHAQLDLSRAGDDGDGGPPPRPAERGGGGGGSYRPERKMAVIEGPRRRLVRCGLLKPFLQPVNLVNCNRFAKLTTSNGGSLGSWVDEDRSKMRVSM